MELRELLLQFVVALLLVIDVVFPVHQLQVGGLDVFLQLLGPFDGSLDLYIGFLLIDLLLQPRQLGLQHLVFRFELVDLLGPRLAAAVLFALVVDREGIFVL